MRLCVPITEAFRSRSETLLPLVDAVSFKGPSEEFYPGKTHFLESSYRIADVGFRGQMEGSGCIAALRSGKYAAFSCDIGPNCERVTGRSRNSFPRAVPISAPISDEEYLDRAVRNVEWLRSQYPGEIQAENNNYFPTGAYERTCEPEFISLVVRAARVSLLLDVGHALVSAHYLQYRSPMEYISQLPLDVVRGIQLSHAGSLNGVVEDLHEAPTDQDLRLVEEILAARAPVEFLSVEYYRHADILCSVYHSLDRWRFGLAGRRG